MSATVATKGTILVVDDDAPLLRLISLRLREEGYGVVTAESGERALGSIAMKLPNLVLTDLQMSGMDGLALFEAIHRDYPSLPVIILTAHGTIPDAVTATTRGVFGFLTKPFEARTLLGEVERALRVSGPATATLAASPDAAWREEIVTRSPAMEEVLQQAKMVSATDASVFIHGESGTGKELLARAIHRASRRSAGEFVAVNCGAIPEPLLESELFGYVKGAFTGAVRDHKGLFQAAHGGTLFLDEIGDMPLALQVKLLRVLQERQVRPVGAVASTSIDVRVVSASHRNLQDELKAGRFREDLYYRLNVVSLSLPPLEQRREDIPLLAHHFLQQLAERYGKRRVRAGTRRARAHAFGIVAGKRAAALQRRGADGRAFGDIAGARVAGPARVAAGGREPVVPRRGEAPLRARLPRAAPQDDPRQRLAGRAARQTQPQRLLRPARSPRTGARPVQGVGRLARSLSACANTLVVPIKQAVTSAHTPDCWSRPTVAYRSRLANSDLTD